MEKKLFDFEAYEQLIAKMAAAAKAGDSDAALDLGAFEKAMASFHEYVSAVGMSEAQIRMAQARLDGAALRDAVAESDAMRHAHHEAAIANAAMLNRMAAAYGVGPIFLGDTAKRLEVAAFCMEVTDELFRRRKL